MNFINGLIIKNVLITYYMNKSYFYIFTVHMHNDCEYTNK